MLKIGALVTHTANPGRQAGVVVETYPPNVYENRLYVVKWQDQNQPTLEEEKNLREIEK